MHYAWLRCMSPRADAYRRMTQRIEFVVYGEPIPQGSHRAFMRKGMRFPVVTDDNRRTKPWRHLVATVAQMHRPPWLIKGAVALELRFYLPRPKSLPKRVRKHTKKPDVDKLTRAALDALTSVLWQDDAQVIRVEATKDYGDPPRVEVVVAEVSDAGPGGDDAAST